MQFLINGIDARLGDALWAVSVVVVIQCVMITVSHFLKRPFTPLTMLEFILRPIVIFLTDKLNRPNRSDISLIIRGVIVLVIIIVTAIGFGMIIEQVFYRSGYGSLMDVALLVLILSPVYPAYIGFKASKSNPPKAAFYYLAQGLNQNLITADDAGQRRNGYRLMALAMVEWMIVPILLYLVGGMGIAYGYAALSVVCRVTGRDEKSSMFLSVFGLIWKLVNIIVSVMGIVLTFMASIFASGGRPVFVLRSFKYLSKGCGVEAAYAYAQNIILGGAIQDRNGHGIKQSWVGRDKASAQLTHQDVIRGCFMHFIAVFLVWVILFAGQVYL